MSFTKTARVLGVAACSIAALHAVPAEAASSARADTGALTSKGVVARTTLISTSGKKLVLTVAGTGNGQGSSVSIGLTSGKENHTWSFKAPASALKVDSTGAGTLTLTSAQTGDRGKLALRFKPSGTMRTQTCHTQVASKSRPLAVSGIAFFKTGTKPWGNVGRSTKAIGFGSGTATWSYDVTCATPPASCASYLSWSAYSFTSTVTQGVSGTRRGTSSTVMGFRSTTLKPAGASRLDMVTAAAPAPTLSGDTTDATLKATLGTGSVSISGGGWSSTTPCGNGGSATTTQWSGAAANGATAFRIPAQVFGAFTVPNGTSASISRQVS